MPKVIQDKILKQEKNLQNNINESHKNEQTSKFLQKSTKKQKNDLLLFKNSISRMKNEVNDCIETARSGLKFNHFNNW